MPPKRQQLRGKGQPPALYVKLSGEDTLRQVLTRYDRRPRLQVGMSGLLAAPKSEGAYRNASVVSGSGLPGKL